MLDLITYSLLCTLFLGLWFHCILCTFKAYKIETLKLQYLVSSLVFQLYFLTERHKKYVI